MPAETRAAAAEAIAARPFPLPITPGVIVSGFMPLKSEINPLPLLRKLAGQGRGWRCPVIAGRGKPLIMRAWDFDDPLTAAVGHPRADSRSAGGRARHRAGAALAFDRAGQRIGYGAGYYDLTLAQLRARSP